MSDLNRTYSIHILPCISFCNYFITTIFNRSPFNLSNVFRVAIKNKEQVPVNNDDVMTLH
jgi:hypothetical protein